jgi:hypothetical protein
MKSIEQQGSKENISEQLYCPLERAPGSRLRHTLAGDTAYLGTKKTTQDVISSWLSKKA